VLNSYEEQFLKTLIEIPSVGGHSEPLCPYGKYPKEALNYFLKEAEEKGFTTGIIDNKVGFVEFGHGDKLLGIVCHLDVVPQGQGWDSEPFKFTVKNDAFYGRGIVDDKGPACAAFFSMLRMKQAGNEPDIRVRLILGTDEERSCSCVECYAEKGELPDFAITPDAEFPVIFAEKGIHQIRVYDMVKTGIKAKGGNAANMVPASASADVKVDGVTTYIQGVGKPAHASKPELGVNAIIDLVNKINESGYDMEKSPLLSFIYNEIATKNPTDFTNCTIEDESGRITSNPGIIRIDDEGESLIIDMRYPVTYDPDKLTNDIELIAGKYGLSVDISNHMDPLYKEKDTEEIKLLTKIWSDNISNYDGFKEEHRSEFVEPLAIGGGTYARHLPNTIAFGLQPPWQEDQCHQANEHMKIKDFETNIKVLGEAIMGLASIL